MLERLEKERKKSGRTLTGEVMFRLEESLRGQDLTELLDRTEKRFAQTVREHIDGGLAALLKSLSNASIHEQRAAPAALLGPFVGDGVKQSLTQKDPAITRALVKRAVSLHQLKDERQAAILDRIYSLCDDAHLEQIVKVLEKGDINGAVRAMGLDPDAYGEFEKTIEQAFDADGNWTGNLVRKVEQEK
jgi:hypothetical protein